VEKINRVKRYNALYQQSRHSKWEKRILAELGYLLELSKVQGGKYDELLLAQIDRLYEEFEERGSISNQTALAAEQALLGLQAEAKKYKITCAAHAHIDMNWMWGFQETVTVTVDTFRTMLALMEEYPDFTFSQSQASVYHIIEEYYPELLEKIKQRVQEGRWELTASTWVENDKNMSGAEAMARHILYTKRYLNQLFGVPEDSLTLDFEPDTFGHNQNMPEVLRNGGIRYYYHCRGLEGPSIYRWQAPSGAEVLVVREYEWYNGEIDEGLILGVPSYCSENQVQGMLKVYGVGDHGGGPTRRDLDAMIEMSHWPLAPQLVFGTIKGYFEEIEAGKAAFPLLKGELNYVFTGCYTSQSRIKRANHIAEDRAYDAEALDACAAGLPGYRTANSFEKAWRKLLFNQFHDILPGSGVIETREFAMGEFQRVMAGVGANSSHAMEALCAAIDTSALAGEQDDVLTAGAGFAVADENGFSFTQSGHHGGSVRVFTIFNTTPYEREETAELTVWDWQGDPAHTYVTDSQGREAPSQVVEKGTHYWGHVYTKIRVVAAVPAMGYAVYAVRERAAENIAIPHDPSTRCDFITDENLVLENDCVRAVFCPRTMSLLSYVRKETGTELLSAEKTSGYFRYIVENTGDGMTSWRVGKYRTVENLNEEYGVSILAQETGPVHQSVVYTLSFLHSTLKVKVSLERHSALLRYDVQADWHEIGNPKDGIPQLGFAVPVAGAVKQYRGDIPFGVLDRAPLRQDVPYGSFICAVPEQGAETVALLSDCKYGYRGADDTLYADLIRGSYDPDPYPEYGVHHMSLAVAACAGAAAGEQLEQSMRFRHPLYAYSTSAHSGALPPVHSFLRIEGGAQACGLKQAESGGGLVLRLYNPYQEACSVKLCADSLRQAQFVDFMEKAVQTDRTLTTDSGCAAFTMNAGEICSVYLQMKS